ncbi:MAG: PQQ-binding-like beta-propeller repeat protein [Candidatus Micrarchaeia archaeon]
MRFSSHSLSSCIILTLLLFSLASANRIKWTSDLNADVTGGILVDGDYIYVSSLDSLSKLQLSDGKIIWSMQLKGTLLNPVKIGSLLVLLSKEGNVYVVSDSTRSVVRTVNISGQILNDPLVVSGILYIPTSAGIVAFNAQTGSILWVQKEACITQSTPLLVDNNLFVVCENGLIKLISTSSGATVDQASYSDVFWKSSPVYVDGRVIIGSFGGNVYAVSQRTPRNFMWIRDTVDGTGIVSDIKLVDKKILISTASGNMCLLEADGTIRWCALLDSESVSSPVVTDTNIYAITDSGTMYGISYDGNVSWKYETGLPVKADIIKKGSMIYGVSKNGTVFALSTSSCSVTYPSDGMDVSGVDMLDVEVDVYADTSIKNVQVRTGEGAWVEASKQGDVYVAKLPIPIGESSISCRVISEDGAEQPPYDTVAVTRKTSGKVMNVDVPSFVGYGSSFNVVVKDEKGNLLDRVNILFGPLQYRNIDGQITITPHTKGKFMLEVRRAGYVPFKKEVEVGDDYTIFMVVIVLVFLFLSVFYIFYRRWMEE